MSKLVPWMVSMALTGVPATRAAWETVHTFPLGEYANCLDTIPAEDALWVGSSTSAGGLDPITHEPLVRTSVRKLSLVDGSTTYLPNDGLYTSALNTLVTGVLRTKTPYPLVLQYQRELLLGHERQDHSPYLYAFDPASASWNTVTMPSGEEASWPGPPGFMTQHDDNDDLILCGHHHVLVSSDGISWSQRSDLNAFFSPPPPYQPGYGAGGLPAWLGVPALSSNAPDFQIYSPGWATGLARMPWGELFCSGEHGSLFHSLDNGVTWSWFDPLLYQPLRDAQGRPLYRNQHTFRLSQTFGVGASGDGEVLLCCKNNLGHHFFLYTSGGQLITAETGLPAYTGGVDPSICQRFATDRVSGQTFMAVRWTGPRESRETPTGRPIDVYRWDGSNWSIIEPPLGWECAFENLLFDDATGVILDARETNNPIQHQLCRWVAEAPAPAPVVNIAGGTSALGAPTATLSAASGRALVALAANASGANALRYQWTSRGPAPVQFEDPRALSPRVWFSAPGDYVLNLRVTDRVTNAHRGASVIVHVLPATGGTAPTLATQPSNAAIGLSGQTAYSLGVAAAGTGPFTYQWKRDGADVVSASAHGPTLAGTASAADLGASFYCVVTSPYGVVVSNSAQLGHAPVIVGQPLSVSLAANGTAILSVAAQGSGPQTWQWLLNGSPIDGAVNASFAATAPGLYSVVVSNAFGSATSAVATVSAAAASNVVRINLQPGDADAPTGTTVYLPGGMVAEPTFPLGQPIPLAVEKTPYGYGPLFIQWTVSGLNPGQSYLLGSPASPQTTLVINGPPGPSPVQVSAVYKDASNLAFHVLHVVNGYGSGEFREAWNYASNISAGPPSTAIEAAPAPVGMVFDRWSGDGPVANTLATSTTVTLFLPRTTVSARYLPAVEAWRTAKFAATATDASIAGDAADPDGDGRANLLEYGLGTDPLLADAAQTAAPREASVARGTTGAPEFTFVRATAAIDVDWRVQVSSDLVNWTDASLFSPVNGDLADTATTTLVSRSTNAGLETITVRSVAPVGTGGRFFRLKLTPAR